MFDAASAWTQHRFLTSCISRQNHRSAGPRKARRKRATALGQDQRDTQNAIGLNFVFCESTLPMRTHPPRFAEEGAMAEAASLCVTLFRRPSARGVGRPFSAWHGVLRSDR